MRERFYDWVAAMEAGLSGIAPEFRLVPVPDDRGRHFAAVFVETERAPFLTRVGKERLETPWLDGNGKLRSASRTDLLRMLAPLSRLPVFDVLQAELSFYRNSDSTNSRQYPWRWSMDATLYVVPPNGEGSVVLPFHRTRFRLGLQGVRAATTEVTLSADPNSSGVRSTDSALLVEGLGSFFFYSYGTAAAEQIPSESMPEIAFELVPTGADHAAIAPATLRQVPVLESHQVARWRL